MQPIIKSNRKFSLKLKMIMIGLIAGGIVSLVFCLKYTGRTNMTPRDLQYSKNIASPKSTVAGGFYKDAFAVALTSPNGLSIYYTTDGTEPTLASSRYSHPIIISDKTEEANYLSLIPTSPRWKPPIGDVFKGTVLRAIAVDEQNNKSTEMAETFFIDKKGKDRYTLPVISIVVNENDFFGYKKGIYVLGKSYSDKDNYIRKDIPLGLPWWEYPSNYLLRGEDAERPAHIEFYEQTGKLGFEANAGIRINGNATRGYAQKSLRICFREKYGQQTLDYRLFSTNNVNTFNSFILRNSGNDWDKTMFRDAFMQSLMKGASIDIQDNTSTIVFINGEYWGIHNLRERFDENYISNKYHCSADSITILELGGRLVTGAKADEKAFTALLDFCQKNQLSKKENYDVVKSKMDLENFTDFIIANVYFCNSDWPNNNVKFWRFQSVKTIDNIGSLDGRWRWMLYDTDWGFGYNSSSIPESDLLLKATSTGSVGILFNSLLKNEEFTKAFISRFTYHLNNTFYTPTVIKKIEQFQINLAPEIQEHIDRWRVIPSYDKWLDNIEVMKDFAKKRPKWQAQQLNAFFNLKGEKQIVIQK
jgi:hypothetical protein